MEYIKIKGAQENNLKSLDCKIPHGQFTVVSGLSGSGKSSLVMDTLYAEGQRRYVESLSSYARQFLERMKKPEVDRIEGVSPAIAVKQRNTTKSNRSTVGTTTEIYDYLRMLFARVGVTFCPDCGDPVEKLGVEESVERILEDFRGDKIFVIFPMETGGVEDISKYLQKAGYVRFFNGDELIDLNREKDFTVEGNSISVILDRLEVKEGIESRLTESVETCFREGEGKIGIRTPGGAEKQYTNRFICDSCGRDFTEPTPKLFSFNNPYGACDECRGFGNILVLDYDRIIPDRELSLEDGAVDPLSKPSRKRLYSKMLDFARRNGIPTDIPVKKLSADQLEMLKEGDENFIGIEGFFDRLKKKKYKIHIRVLISKYRKNLKCRECNGSKLRSDALNIRIAGKNIADINAMSIEEAEEFFENLELEGTRKKIADRILREIRERINYLNRVGVSYLTLDRLASTLSGGEAQRINLASILGSSMVGMTVILDEPTIGLHPRDNDRLIEILKSLRDQGNAVVVVEHDREVIKSADYIIELGPEAGSDGGNIVYQGNVEGLMEEEQSYTKSYLTSEKRVSLPEFPNSKFPRKITVKGASEHNLKDIDVKIPLGGIICVTGVSGSGKSTLIHDTVFAHYQDRFDSWDKKLGKCSNIEGFQRIEDMIMVDQSPVGKSSRSNPATYLKAFDGIRRCLASTSAARRRGLSKSPFSFNVKGGRCENCKGIGTVTEEMQFLPDVEILCEDCDGKRYKEDILEVKYRGYNINEILNLTVVEAMDVFAGQTSVTKKLKPLVEVGLDYIEIGQTANSLSGGEAQRLKLASFLAEDGDFNRLFIFDEPTTGLHIHDIQKLLKCFRRLVRRGDSVVIIEHNPDVIKNADYIIDLGPEGGQDGGYVVATGTPEDIMDSSESYTGKYLRQMKEEEKSRRNSSGG